MDDNDRKLLAEAQRYEEEGETLYNNRTIGKTTTTTNNDTNPSSCTTSSDSYYEECIRTYQKALAIRESVHGRYHSVTARSYRMIGKAYNKICDPRAIVAYKTRHRINTFLYGKCNGPIDKLFADVLASRGITDTIMKEIQHDIGRSVRYEMEGDTLRRTGSRKAAGNEYHKSARLEEYTFGKMFTLLCFVWPVFNN